MENNSQSTSIKETLKIFVTISGILLIIVSPWLFVQLREFKDTGEIGDTIGGITSPLVGLLGAILVYFALKEQIKANEMTRDQFSKQDRDNKINRFESRFYQLLALHKETVDEISLAGYNGKKVEKRKAFESMYREFRYSFFLTKETYDKLRRENSLSRDYSDIELTKLAYIFFYAGVSSNYDHVTNAMTNNDEFEEALFDKVKEEITRVNRTHKANRNNHFSTEIALSGLGSATTAKSYRPYSGHMPVLGHYYRHLYQTVSYVVKQDEKLIPHEDKLEYLRTLRAQLTDHEQVLLYYNAIAEFGEEWIIHNYFTEYRMIRNIPLPLANFGIKPEEKFAVELNKDPQLFEWLE